MKIKKFSKKPTDIESRVGAEPVICYPNESINSNLEILHEARKHIEQINEVIVPPRDAKTFNVKSGNFFRIESVEGPQVGDLNLFQAEDGIRDFCLSRGLGDVYKRQSFRRGQNV